MTSRRTSRNGKKTCCSSSTSALAAAATAAVVAAGECSSTAQSYLCPDASCTRAIALPKVTGC